MQYRTLATGLEKVAKIPSKIKRLERIEHETGEEPIQGLKRHERRKPPDFSGEILHPKSDKRKRSANGSDQKHEAEGLSENSEGGPGGILYSLLSPG